MLAHTSGCRSGKCTCAEDGGVCHFPVWGGVPNLSTLPRKRLEAAMPGSDLCRCHLAQVTGSRPAEPGSTLMPGHTSSHWARAGRPSEGQLYPLLSAIFATCQEGKPCMERRTACLHMGPQPLSGRAGVSRLSLISETEEKEGMKPFKILFQLLLTISVIYICSSQYVTYLSLDIAQVNLLINSNLIGLKQKQF